MCEVPGTVRASRYVAAQERFLPRRLLRWLSTARAWHSRARAGPGGARWCPHGSPQPPWPLLPRNLDFQEVPFWV